MILNGNQRGGARDLALHLMKPENEHVELHDIRGFVADELVGALREAEAISRGTRCRQFLYSLSLSPPEAAHVTVADFENAIDRIEAKLGLAGQPRVIIFHEKHGRRHAHAVWSRIDVTSMTAVRMSHDRTKLTEMSRELYLEHGWRMPDGLLDKRLRSPLNFDRKEWFKAKRAGKDPRDIKAALQQCWAASDSGKAFRRALEQRGYYLARGDRRAIVAIDLDGEIYAVSRWTGLRTKQVRERMGDGGDLPSVDEARSKIAFLVKEKLSAFIPDVTAEFNKAAESLEARRLVMVESHQRARADLRAVQQKRSEDEARQRAARFRPGLRGLWDRVTGRHAQIERANAQEVEKAAQRDAAEGDNLVQAQLRERQALQRETLTARHVHARDLARIHRDIASAARSRGLSGDPGEKDLVETRRHRRRRERSGPQ